jgi:hypothetical protein
VSHLTIILLIIGAFALILGTIKAVGTYFENRGEEMVTFRNHFEPEYCRDFLRQSSWCDNENLNDPRNRIDTLKDRDRGATESFSNGRSATWRNRNRD